MKSQAQRAAKRRAREHRDGKGETWKCSGCGDRHPHGERCPIRRERVDPYGTPSGGLDMALIGALGALARRGPQ